jgi:phosphatidylserine/phosphatidylglycerophosphate/cardiolipin synthase-like enzyme
MIKEADAQRMENENRFRENQMRRLLAVAVVLAISCFQSLFAQTPLPSTASFDVGFSPSGTALAVVEKAIGSSESEILMACYEFTSRDVAEALEAAAYRGVKVRIVADWKASQDRFSQIGILQDAGIPVRLDRHYAIHHNKFMVIDGTTLETGSFNYTTAADKHNAENALVLWNVPQIAQIYAKEWERLWEESK